jgi:hypothetical protein
MEADNDPVWRNNFCEATEIITVVLEEVPPNPLNLQMMAESEVQDAFSEEDLPDLHETE